MEGGSLVLPCPNENKMEREWPKKRRLLIIVIRYTNKVKKKEGDNRRQTNLMEEPRENRKTAKLYITECPGEFNLSKCTNSKNKVA